MSFADPYAVYVIAAYGIWKAGGVLVQVNPLYRGNDLAFILKDSGARFAVVFARFFPQVREVLPHTALEGVIVTRVHDFFLPLFRLLYGLTKPKKEGDVFPHEEKVLPFASLLRGPRLRRPVEVAQEDLAMLQYTGGTTGLSKGAMLSHRNLVCNLTQARIWVTDLKEGQERILSVVPFFHVYGVTLCMNLAVAVGATNIMILMPGFVARTTAEVAHRYRPTIFPGAPPIYLAVNQLKDVQRYNLRSIRNCVSGSSSLPVEVQKRFEELTGARLVEGYGLSEASTLTHANPLAGTRKVGSIGIPVPNTDARIVDAEGGERELKAGEASELIVRGPQVMMGYWNNPRETAQTLRGGWLYTGDIARMREAAVVGVSSRVRGEMLVAHVVPRDGDDMRALRRELRDFCAARLAPYKVPRRIEIVPEIPKTVGIPKALRRVIREREQARGEEAGDEEL